LKKSGKIKQIIYQFIQNRQYLFHSRVYGWKYVLCARFCQRLWIVILGYPLRFCLTFIDMWLLSIVWLICDWKGSQCPVPHLNLNDCQNKVNIRSLSSFIYPCINLPLKLCFIISPFTSFFAACNAQDFGNLFNNFGCRSIERQDCFTWGNHPECGTNGVTYRNR
jgi:hypothetical protein